MSEVLTMKEYPVARQVSGTIRLGSEVCCDGFNADASVRVQSHIHTDHTAGFSSSINKQNILLSRPTLDLLASESEVKRNKYECCSNLRAFDIENDKAAVYHDPDGSFDVELKGNNHMLGSVQCAVTYANGPKMGYSGDFSWPMSDVLQVDHLVVDSTYGNPAKVRPFDQTDVDEVLQNAIAHRISANLPIALHACTGRLQSAMNLLTDFDDIPVICEEKTYRYAKIYEKYSYRMPKLFLYGSPESKEIFAGTRRYVVAVEAHRKRQVSDVLDCCSDIKLSAFINGSEPILEYATPTKDCCIVYTDHADFTGTIDYIKNSGATFVYTDSRGGNDNHELLAEYLNKQCNIDAQPLRPVKSHRWGYK